VDCMNPRIHDSPARPARLHESAELIVADISRPDTWSSLLETIRPDVVIHLAAETDTGLSLGAVTRFSEVNVLGTAVMLDSLVAHDAIPQHLVVASTRAVYGEGQWRDDETQVVFSPGQRTHRQLVDRQWDFPGASPIATRAPDTTVHPTNIYGVTKYAQESMIDAWAGGRDVAFTALRLQNVYGPGQSLINPYTGILPLFTQTAARGEAIDVYEDGLMTRDFVHIDDTARAFAAAIEQPPTSSRVLDVGGGEATTILEVARLVARVAGGAEPRVSGRFRDGDIRHAWCATDDTTAALRWTPTVGWREGISDYAQWVLGLGDERAKR
jgi:dTDP-L-rhamnose 4-epimerase